jgi:hypothetical protein
MDWKEKREKKRGTYREAEIGGPVPPVPSDQTDSVPVLNLYPYYIDTGVNINGFIMAVPVR